MLTAGLHTRAPSFYLKQFKKVLAEGKVNVQNVIID